jgi:hypothetical protein
VYRVYLVVVVVSLVYFVPTVIAGRRRHVHLLPIFVVNLVLGWTLFAWVGCLVWAVRSRLSGR